MLQKGTKKCFLLYQFFENLVDHAKKTNITVFDFFNKDATVFQGLRSDFWQITDIFESKSWSIENEDFEEEGTPETHVLLFENSEYPDYTGASSSDFWDRRKRRSGDFEGEVQHRGFEEPLWVPGSQATITFISDEHREFRGFEFEITANKMNVIQNQAEKIFSALSDDLKWKDRFVNRLTKILTLANSSYTGEKCAEENGFENEIPSDLIFDAEDTCPLNDQVNQALNSFAKSWACQGSGKVYKQIINKAAKIKTFFDRKFNC
ncbi:Oidioi.mRNA.OKI2018_I69.chr1.g1339.t1.cds [Oikopleura dioica]|uniref:Oidioi.mRNA.OKI2018_I69.chr1.g1339.t1.cds n=1 Tax=Oikopleura dioica TaxID=34765 RepID=A0ABN7SWU1_OIKDI|nr:Oidioi.mRNA.OKI2018_I69.chr1.g1339.t1.cds [Oikopleura dioica]